MNKIVIDESNVELKKITKKLDIQVNKTDTITGIINIQINVLGSTNLEIVYHMNANKYLLTINVMPGVKLTLATLKEGSKGKIQSVFNLFEEGEVTYDVFNSIKGVKEMLLVNLNGPKASFNYNFKGIATDKETYDIVINHNYKDTVSNIRNNTVNIDNGKVTFQVSSYVPNGIKNCLVNQANRIINFTNNKCEIRPNLYVDEFDTTANHSALIGGFDSNEMFYLKSRGITEDEANKLLISGFLLSDLNSQSIIRKIRKTIKEYWR